MNSWTHRRCDSKFKSLTSESCYGLRSWTLPVDWVNATECPWWLIDVASSNGLVSSANKPLPELMLTQDMASPGHNEFRLSSLSCPRHFALKMIRNIGNFYCTGRLVVTVTRLNLLAEGPHANHLRPVVSFVTFSSPLSPEILYLQQCGKTNL